MDPEHLYAPLPDAKGRRGESRSVGDVMEYFGRALTRESGAAGKALLESKLRRKALLLDGGGAAPRPKARPSRKRRREADSASARGGRCAELPTWASTARVRAAWRGYAVAVLGAPDRRPRGAARAAADLDLTGAVVEVCRAPSESLVGAAGAVVDETAACLFLRTTTDKLLRLPKQDAVFALHVDGGANVDGGAQGPPCLVLPGSLFLRPTSSS